MYDGDFHNWVNASGVMYPIYNPTTQTTAADGTVTVQRPDIYNGRVIPFVPFTGRVGTVIKGTHNQ